MCRDLSRKRRRKRCNVGNHIILFGAVYINAPRSDYFQKALEIYEDGTNGEYRKKEASRTCFLMGMVFAKNGMQEQAHIANVKAQGIRATVLGDEYFPAAGLQSYDEIVGPWQR